MGARAGRTSNAETVEAAARRLAWLQRSQWVEFVDHTCHGYTRGLTRFDTCPACGWGPSFPYPDARACALALAALVGADDATAWFIAALRHLEWD